MTTQTKWTPGPWELFAERDGDYLTVNIGAAPKQPYRHPQHVCKIYGWGQSFDRDAEQQANARLIAAAPELVEALRSLAQIDLADGNADLQRDRFMFLDSHPEFIGYAKTARALLARVGDK